MKLLKGLFSVVAIAVLSLCSQKIAGTATETENVQIAGNLRNADGSPASGEQVFLRPTDYLPTVTAKVSANFSFKTLDSTFTDFTGGYRFDSIAPGIYIIECLDTEDGVGALIDSVLVADSDSSLDLSADTLRPLGSIAGQIQLPESLDASQVRVLVYGLNRVATPDSVGEYAIPGLAAGTYALRIQLSDQGVNAKPGLVTSGDTTWLQKTVLPGADRIYAKKALGAITADGILDEPSWDSAREMKFSSLAASENLITVRVLWDSSFLYVSYDVLDTFRGVDGTADIHNDDGAEFFLDPDHNGSDSIDVDDMQFLMNINDEIQLMRGDAVIRPEILAKTHLSGLGYVTEIIIPWSVIGKSPTEGLVMGALFANNDNDQMVAAQFDWLGIRYLGNETYKRPNLWGDLVLTP